jgi:hypothetical protein
MQTRRTFVTRVTSVLLAAASGKFSRLLSFAFADGCNLNQITVDALTKCQVIGITSTDPGGSLNIEFDDSEGETIIVNVGQGNGQDSNGAVQGTGQSVNAGDPNYAAAVALLSNGQVPAGLAVSLDFLSVLLGVLAELTSEGAATPFLLALFGKTSIVAGTAAITAHALGSDPPRSDTNIVNIFHARELNLAPAPTAQEVALQAFMGLCFQLSNGLTFLIATKERIEALIAAKSFGVELVAQLNALNQNAAACAPVLQGMATQSRQVASDLLALLSSTSAAAAETPMKPGPSSPMPVITQPPVSIAPAGVATNPALSSPALTIDRQQIMLGLYQPIRQQLQVQFQPGPNTLDRLDLTANAIANAIGQVQLAASTDSPLLTQASNQFKDVATASDQMQTYLQTLATDLSKVNITSGQSSTSGGTDTGSTPTTPTKPLKGESPCTKC